MQVARPVLCLALVASLAGAGTSWAATKPKAKPVCNLVLDPAGDANAFVVENPGAPFPPSDDYLDVLSADLASDAKNITAVIRLKAMGEDQQAPTGFAAYFAFSIAGTQVFLVARKDITGAYSYSYGDYTGANDGRKGLGAAKGSFVPAKREIHITAPVTAWPVKIKPGMKLSGLDVLAQRTLASPVGSPVPGVPTGITATADQATGSKSYPAGSLSCVKPGS